MSFYIISLRDVTHYVVSRDNKMKNFMALTKPRLDRLDASCALALIWQFSLGLARTITFVSDKSLHRLTIAASDLKSVAGQPQITLDCQDYLTIRRYFMSCIATGARPGRD